jgi:hypothetical protein
MITMKSLDCRLPPLSLHQDVHADCCDHHHKEIRAFEEESCISSLDEISTKQPSLEYSHTTGKAQVRRRVRFAVDENDFVTVPESDILIFQSELNAEAISALHLSREEEKEIRRGARKGCCQFRKDHPCKVKLLSDVYMGCGRLRTNTPPFQQEQVNFFLDWVGSDVRGLERYVSRQTREERKKVVSFVVNYQNALKYTTDPTAANFDELLRQRIVGMSRRAREFAGKMAVADEIEAAKMVIADEIEARK